MLILGIGIGCLIGWAVPQPIVTYYAPGTSIGERVQLTTYLWRKSRDIVRDWIGMN